VLLPVGIGVIAGVVLVGNLLEWMLRRFRQATLGVLLGLLLGSIVGLWPFQVGVQPKPGDWVKGEVVTQANVGQIDAEDWPTKYFQPTPIQVANSIFLLVVGFGATMGVSLIGGKKGDGAEPTAV
jgi:putative membrane protein